MKLTTGASVLALSLLIAGPAFAQTQTQTQPAPSQAPRTTTDVPKAPAPVTGQIVVQDGNSVLAKELIGATVYAPDKTKIGSISDLILSHEGGRVEGVVLGVGGFLGIGEKSVALQMDRVKMMRDKDGLQITASATKDELSQAPAFKSRKDMAADKRAADRPTSPSNPGPAAKPTTR